MSVDVAQLVGGAFGGAIASSVLGPWIAQGKERRDMRANVLRALSEVERTRWADPDMDWHQFRTAVHGLRAAALVAKAPRELVDRYIEFATVARSTSDWSAEIRPEEDGGGGIDSRLGDLVVIGARAVTDHIWHPVRSRWRLSRDLAKLDAYEHEARTKLSEDPFERIQWDARLI